MNLAPFVDMVLLSMNLMVQRSVVCVLQSPEYWILLPPTANGVLFGSALPRQMSHMICLYVTSFFKFGGIWLWWMNKIVLIPLTCWACLGLNSKCNVKMSIATHFWSVALLPVTNIPIVSLLSNPELLPQIHCCLGTLRMLIAFYWSCCGSWM